MEAQIQALVAQMQQMAADNQRMAQAVQAAQQQAAAATAAATAAASAGGGAGSFGGGGSQGDSAWVSKWTPAGFSGKEQDWRTFQIKFRSFLGATLKGVTGQWMDYVRDNRESYCKLATIDPGARPAAALLYSSLIATCEDKALALVERAGEGEGLEAWRLLLGRYDQQTRQSRMVRLIQVLGWEFKGELQDDLEQFDRACLKYQESTKKDLDDDLRIGVVIKGMEAGALREHLLLHSERALTYEEFRQEVHHCEGKGGEPAGQHAHGRQRA
jgi:hypothetical protein